MGGIKGWPAGVTHSGSVIGSSAGTTGDREIRAQLLPGDVAGQ